MDVQALSATDKDSICGANGVWDEGDPQAQHLAARKPKIASMIMACERQGDIVKQTISYSFRLRSILFTERGVFTEIIVERLLAKGNVSV